MTHLELGIPTRFKLFGQEIEVLINDDLFVTHQRYGEFNSVTYAISIQPPTDNIRIPLSAIHTTLWHEKVHALLHILGYDELNGNEQFVDQMGQSLFQLVETLEYE